jgi:hypothetical protein
VNPSQLLESIKRIFERRTDVRIEAQVAREAGLEADLISEYSALRKSIEVDKNLLAVLKKSSSMNTPGQEVNPEDIRAISQLEEKVRADEQRLSEIHSRFKKAV